MTKLQLFKKPMLFVWLLLCGSSAFSQVTEQWVRRYDGPSGTYDNATAVVVDAAGNVYVTGVSETTTSSDYATIKYDAAGNALWIKRYDGPKGLNDAPAALAVDVAGNVYVTGYSTGSGYATIKYNAGGTQLWAKTYGNSDAAATALAVDASGNVYVTGYGTGSGGTYDFTTIKYDAAGAVLWVKQYDGTGQDFDGAANLVVDATGYVYVTGYSDDRFGFPDYATVKYDAVGRQLWVRRYDSGDRDFATSLAVDASGNVYVTGNSHVGEDGSDYTTIKYDGAGNRLWTKKYNNGSNPKLVVDASGNVYVSATSRTSGSFADFATAKLNANGTEQWLKKYSHPGGFDDLVSALAVDSAGNAYVTGSSANSRVQSDYATVKYDAAGAEVWVNRYDGGDNDGATALAVDALGNVYVTGSSFNYSDEGNLDYATIKYSQTQTLAVSSFTLINADSEEAIQELNDGDTINLEALATLNLNIRANTSPGTIGSVVFKLNGAEMRTHTENISPYALFADNNQGDYYAWTPTNGNYTLTATPYRGAKGRGDKGEPLTVHFTVTGRVVSSLILVNAETDQDIKTLENGDVIDLAALPTDKLNIRAVVHPDTVGSVVFNLNNRLIVRENLVPYAIGGDVRGNYRAWTLPTGQHTLTATPHEAKYGRGKKGKGHRVSFTVVDRSVMTRSDHSKEPILEAAQNKGQSLSASPNPSTGQTTISFSVHATGRTVLEVLDVKGTVVQRLYEAQAQADKGYTVSFNSKHLAAGVYVLRLVTNTHVRSAKLVLIR